MNYKALAALLRGERPHPLKLAAPAALAADDAAVPYVAVVAPTCAPAPIRAQPAPEPVDVLLAALDIAADDAHRAALIAGAPATVRTQLAAALTHREMTAPPRKAALDALVASLAGAADDAQRTALLSASSPALRAALAEHLYWRNATPDDAQRQYLALLGVAE